MIEWIADSLLSSRSGNPDDTVTLNGTDNKVGTARTYESNGAHVVETLTLYMKPNAGPYAEIHTLAPLTVPSLNLSFYADYDANFAGPTCNGAATLFNETVNFCATNATQAAGVFHQLHLADVMTVGKLLGGQNFTSCAVLGNSTSNSTSSNANATSPTNTTTTSKVTSSVPTTTTPPTQSSPSSSASKAPSSSSSSSSSFSSPSLSTIGSVLLAGVVALATLSI